jgi:hypothetical protein
VTGTDLLGEALHASGGLDRWREARMIRARVRSGGLLVHTRMPGNRFADYAVEVSVAEPRTVMDPFPRAGERAVFDAGDVRIETADGEVLESRERALDAFSGASGLRRNLRWDPLDSAYFVGYAMWNYLTFPYLLTGDGFELAEGEPWEEQDERWRRLEVTFPPGLHTHSPSQVFYFDSRGLLRRHDYVAEVVGRWAKAGHYVDDHVKAGGLVFPTRRRVRPVARPSNRTLGFPTLVSIDLSELEVH